MCEAKAPKIFSSKTHELYLCFRKVPENVRRLCLCGLHYLQCLLLRRTVLIRFTKSIGFKTSRTGKARGCLARHDVRIRAGRNNTRIRRAARHKSEEPVAHQLHMLPPFIVTSEAERCASAAHGSRSVAEAGGRRLQAVVRQ